MKKESKDKTKKTSIQLDTLDHYTLIVKNAKKVTEFHTKCLGFKFKAEKLINTGTVHEPGFDMINHILNLPDNPNLFCVVTQGMNEKTVFAQYLKKFGPGIHHLAFKVNNLEEEWLYCKANNIGTTSKEIIIDPVSGLKQFFITKNHAGYFIELIERTDEVASQSEDFTAVNMKKLSDSIKAFLKK